MGLSFGPGGTAQRPFTHRPGQMAPSQPSLFWPHNWSLRMAGDPHSTVQCQKGPPLYSLLCGPRPRISSCSGLQYSLRGEDDGRKGALEGAHLLPPSLTGLWHCTGSCFCGALCKETESFLSPCHVGGAATAHPAMEHPQGKRGDCWKHTRHHRTGPPGHLLNNSSGSTGLRARALWKCSPLEEFVILHST